MEGSNTLSSSGVTVVGSDAPSNYHVAPRTAAENPTGSEPPAAAVAPPPASVSPAPAAGGAAGAGSATSLKKKRGRPRKYGPDGSVAVALSPKPISSSAPPPVIDFSAVAKRGKVRSITSAAKVQLPGMEAESMGMRVFQSLCVCVCGASACMSMELCFMQRSVWHKCCFCVV